MNEQKTNVTGYVPEEIAEEVERYSERNDVSKSRAVQHLLERGLMEESWDRGVAQAQDFLDDPENVVFYAGAATPEGDIKEKRMVRQPGVESRSSFSKEAPWDFYSSLHLLAHHLRSVAIENGCRQEELSEIFAEAANALVDEYGTAEARFLQFLAATLADQKHDGMVQEENDLVFEG